MPKDYPRKDWLDIRRLKAWARTSLPSGSALRIVLLSEDDTLSTEAFLGKSDTWLKLARSEYPE